jgi:hypothetical protein
VGEGLSEIFVYVKLAEATVKVLFDAQFYSAESTRASCNLQVDFHPHFSTCKSPESAFLIGRFPN